MSSFCMNNRLQTIGEGWAAPLKGFMREGALVQALHHNRCVWCVPTCHPPSTRLSNGPISFVSYLYARVFQPPG